VAARRWGGGAASAAGERWAGPEGEELAGAGKTRRELATGAELAGAAREKREL
jgi:hypothetical protein